jgi:Polyketide cyclase / dehydrase and lipid transport
MNVTETVVVTARPDAVWDVVGDAGAIADWVPAIESSRLEGDVRHATFAGGGGDATERIVEHDDAARSYVYEFLSGPLPLEVYRSRLSVRDHASGAEVVWDAEFSAASPDVEAELAEAIGGIYRSSLAELKTRVES